MTTKADLSPAEWQVVVEGPPTAGTIVVMAAHGGIFRETYAISKAYAQARAQHGASELLDEIVTERPEMDRTKYSSPDELREHGLAHLRDATAILADKATPAELDDYRHFVVTLATNVADAHREDGQQVDPAEADAIGQIADALGTTAS